MGSCSEKAENHCRSYPRCYGCGAYREPTNADRIRAMSDEELAEFLTEWNENQRAWRRDTYGELAAWLKDPVKGGEVE